MWYQRACTRALAGLSQGILAFSSLTEDYLRQLDIKCSVFRVPQAVPQSTRSPSFRTRTAIRKFGYLGSNSARKNVAALVEAFCEICVPGVELHIAGFEPSAHDRVLKNAVWYGYVDGEKKDNFLTNIDALILPSLAEPWGWLSMRLSAAIAFAWSVIVVVLKK
jgi:glycosyltransferase involved in cell wall biosynthesis